MKSLIILICICQTSLLCAGEAVPFLGQKDVLDVTGYTVQYYAFKSDTVRAVYSAGRHKYFKEHAAAVQKKIELSVRATPPDIATLVELIRIPEGPIDSINVKYRGEAGGDTIDYWLDFTSIGHASVHSSLLLETVQSVGELRREYSNCPGITDAIPPLIRIAECKNVNTVAQFYLKLICMGEPNIWDENDKGFEYRNAACISLGEFGMQADKAIPMLEKLVSDKNLPGAAVALAMIQFDFFVHAKDEQLIKSFEKAAESIPALAKTAIAGDIAIPIRLAAIKLLGRFGPDAKTALPALKSICEDPTLSKLPESPLRKAAQIAVIAIEKGEQTK